MAKTAAERKRDQIARDGAMRRQLEDVTYPLARPSFGSFLDDHPEEMQLRICYDGMNREPPDFSTESNPVSATGSFIFPTREDGAPCFSGALGRAELEVDLLIEAAKSLSIILNDYKRAAIRNRIAEIERTGLLDPATRKVELSELLRLNKALETLDKTYRVTLPQWDLRGL